MTWRNKSRIDAKGRNADRAGSAERTIITRRSLWHSPHVSALSTSERALMMELASMFNGTNNGTLFLSVRDATARLGFGSFKAAQDAFEGLLAVGLISETFAGSFSMKAGEVSRARAFRLNWYGADGRPLPAEALPPLDFSKLTPKQKRRVQKRSKVLEEYVKDIQKGKFAVTETDTLLARSVTETGTLRRTTVSESGTPVAENGSFASPASVTESATYILHHIPCAERSELHGLGWWSANRIVGNQIALLGLYAAEPMRAAA